MTLKVIRVGPEVKAASDATRQKEQDTRTEAVRAQRVPASVLSAVVSTEAAVVSTSKAVNRLIAPSSVEKIKEYKEAKDLAEEVSGRIKSDSAAEDAHSEIDPVAAKEHLLS